jgi:hypothetical protein
MDSFLEYSAAIFSVLILIAQIGRSVRSALNSKMVVIKITGDQSQHYSEDPSGNFYRLDPEVKIEDISKPSDREIRDVSRWLLAARAQSSPISSDSHKQPGEASL